MKEEYLLTKARKRNLKLYSIYRTVSFDLLFYYAIDFLFLTQVKGINAAEVTLATGMYALFMVILQIPMSIVIDKIGTRISTFIANLFNAIFIILIINCNDLSALIFAQFVSALCYSMKNISDKALLNYSIPETKRKGEIFSRLEGRGTKHYHFLNAITVVLSGVTYTINPYIAMIFSFIFTIIAAVISLGFKDIESYKKLVEEEKKEEKHYFKELKKGIKFIFNSQRLRSLLIYGGIAEGIFALMITYRISLLVDIGVNTVVIAIIASIVGVAAGIGSQCQTNFHKKFRNKSLSIILISITTSILIAGIIGIMPISFITKLILITLCFIIIQIAKGISGVLTTRYLGNFSDEKMLTQIYAVNAMSENGIKAIIGFVGAYLLTITNTANAMIIVGLLLLVAVIGLISYMKTRLGLKPEQYGETEIYRLKRKNKAITNN